MNCQYPNTIDNIKESIHPEWYYKFYKLLFDRKNGYQEEISLINQKVPLFGKKVQEIGAGIGGHAVELLKYNLSNICLADIDLKACEILKDKFPQKNVSIKCLDGFKKEQANYDVVICMYSIIQFADYYETIINRLKSIYKKLLSDGSFFFEIIDFEISEQVFPNNEINILHKEENNIVKVFSEYHKEFFTIAFFGKIDKIDIYYDVKLKNIKIEKFISDIKELGWKYIEIIPLDNFKRKLLFWLKK